MTVRVLVVGGGAAGLMAAGRAGEVGAEVVLVEHTRTLGAKLRLTGHGRCNLTHTGDVQQFVAHVFPDGSFLYNAMSRFFVTELVDFFHRRGLETVAEPDGRVFPASYRAQDVVDTLQDYCIANGVRFRTGVRVVGLLSHGQRVAGVAVADGTTIEANRVILATGGLSYPQTGSRGDGYRLAQSVGHTLVSPKPGLVPWVTAEKPTRMLQGLSLEDVRVRAYASDRLLADLRGAILFTHFGISGPLILSLSLRLADEMDKGPLRLVIDLQPQWTSEWLEQRIQKELAERGQIQYSTFLRDIMPRRLADMLADSSGIPRDQRLNQMSTEQRGKLYCVLKEYPLTILRPRPMREAMVTVGGIPTNEIDPRTMESRLMPGLYFAGEIIDVAGDTGGYNLQIAFTTGHIAGESSVGVRLGGHRRQSH